MYMPVPKGVVRKNPMQVRESQKYMFAAINMVLGTIGFTIYGLYTYVQSRNRGGAADGGEGADRLLEDGSGNRAPLTGLAAFNRATPKRVIVVGASAAGATTAAMLVKEDPSLEVVVFDESRRVTLTALVPYAQVGHRSYDLSTSGAPDSLSSPTTWSVTREAKLVPKGVTTIKPDRNIIVDTDGIEHTYDALVLATGTVPDIDGCNIKGLKEANVDKHRVCMSPHITRDTLQTVWDGNIVCAKVATRAHNRARQQWGGNGGQQRRPKLMEELLKDNERMRALAAISSPSSSSSIAAAATAALTSSSSSSTVSGFWSANHFTKAYVKGSGPMIFDRSCDVAFVSSINLLWKFLSHFNKLHRMPLSVYCDEDGPCEGLGHADYTRQVMDYWFRRNIAFYGRQRLVEVDVLNCEATFEAVHEASHHGNNTLSASSATPLRTKVPYKLLFLDFPRKAPALIEKAGLSCLEADGYVAVDPSTLQHVHHKNVFAVGDCAALPTLKSYGAVFTQCPVVSHNVIHYLNYVKRLPTDVGAQLADGCHTVPYTAEEQQRMKNALDNKKGGGGAPLVIKPKQRSPQGAAAAKAAIFADVPAPIARYDGYSSAPLAMTPWRLMWPERHYDAKEVRTVTTNGYTYPSSSYVSSSSSSSDDGTAADSIIAQQQQQRINCHKWNNTEWEGVRGLLNGVYLQLFGYEAMYWFVFMRGHWHPPTWFTAAKFPRVGEDGIDHDLIPAFDRAAVTVAAEGQQK